MISLCQKLRLKKHAKNDSTIMLELFCAKTRLKKHQIFEKSDDFKNRPSRKGYNLCKMVSLGQKLKFKKTRAKRFYSHINVYLVKNPLEHDEIHRGLKSQTPADVRLLSRRTSAGELCRNVKLLTCQLGEGDKISDKFDSYLSTRVRCVRKIIAQFVNNKLAALKCSFPKLP